MKSASYKPATCCSYFDCDFHNDNPDAPCWGQVECVDEYWNDITGDSWWVHACEGHKETSFGGDYVKE